MEITLAVKIPGDVAAIEQTFLIFVVLFLSLNVWPYFSIFFHELGHFVCAKLVGMSPRLMRIGSGSSIFRKRFFGAQLELCIMPFGGLTYAYHPDTGWSKFEDLKLKLITCYIGGCLANSVLLVCSITMLVYTEFPFFIYFICIEIMMIIISIVPNDGSPYGMKFPSDGKCILLILTNNYQRFFSAYHQKDIVKITGDRAELQIFFKNDIRTIELFVKAETELAHRHFDKAIALFNQLLIAENASDVEKAYTLDLLASIVIIYGQKQYLDRADRWSQEALKLAGHSKTLQGTRGAVLIEMGQYEEGKQMLLPLTKPGNDPIDIILGSYYLTKADHRLGNNEQARTWLRQAEMVGKNVPVLPEMFASIKQELRESLN